MNPHWRWERDLCFTEAAQYPNEITVLNTEYWTSWSQMDVTGSFKLQDSWKKFVRVAATYLYSILLFRTTPRLNLLTTLKVMLWGSYHLGKVTVVPAHTATFVSWYIQTLFLLINIFGSKNKLGWKLKLGWHNHHVYVLVFDCRKYIQFTIKQASTCRGYKT